MTLDDATSRDLSAFLAEEEGTASTFRGLARSKFGEHGLPMSLYTDPRIALFSHAEGGAPVDRTQPTQVGRALAALGVEHIAAYSPQARGRSERAFQTLQDRLVKELALAKIDTVEAADAYLRDVFIPDYNARFGVAAEQAGTAFTPIPGVDLDEVLCVHEERQVGNDNCVSFNRLKLQLPPTPCAPTSSRPAFACTTTSRAHAIFHGPRCLARYDAKGDLKPEKDARLSPLDGEPVDGGQVYDSDHPAHRRTNVEAADDLMSY